MKQSTGVTSVDADGQELDEALASRLRDIFKQPATIRLHKRTTYRWSDHFLFVVTPPDGPEQLVLAKRIREHDSIGRRQAAEPAAERAAAEFAALETIERLVNSQSNPVLTSIHPLFCLPSAGVLAMEYQPGSDFLKLAVAASSPFASATQVRSAYAAAGWAGEWLAMLHRGAPVAESTPSVRSTETIERLRSQLHHAVGSKAGDWNHSARLLLKRLELHPPSELRAVVQHGDFYPDNAVKSHDQRLYVIDTALSTLGSPMEDVAKFLVGIDTMKGRLFGRPLVTSRLSSIREAFLEGYRRHGKISEWWLAIALLRALIVRRSELLAAAARMALGPLNPLMTRRIDRFIGTRITALDRKVPS